ncbi:2-oxopent-4-enoate hydratase [Beggiatoa leptomitoformis]|uniref:2-oxopent-4-enoate hydratase n=1 Tax=Beggiatoa leptomitoformis TaxID=288004 RepID=A0A2N9YC85_9GAMM|nr:2-oxopent-4-enoate hydratase [Beggiatoa leptomitoformis]ALG66616.1 2-oxopent-4-enoate hydratase [Beggiatoa leptomitoformis]AUI68073.1 2-oxopent-4-enoate hydratase [Beggiatoa leptomitoformis]
MDLERIQRYGDALYQALCTCQPIAPLTDTAPDLSIEEAYHIQLHIIEQRKAKGERVIGKKIGLTSKAIQTMLNVNQPDFGHLMSGMVYSDGDEIPVKTLLQPKAEGEIAFILKRDLNGPGITNADVLAATECVMPCFEIVDSRVKDWKIKIQDTIADNASSGVFVLGGTAISPHKLDLSLCGMVLEKNGEVLHTGAGAAALGSPVNCVTWLANTLGRLGIPLKAGEVILSGALAAMVSAQAGDNMRVSIGGLGSTTIRFC